MGSQLLKVNNKSVFYYNSCVRSLALFLLNCPLIVGQWAIQETESLHKSQFTIRNLVERSNAVLQKYRPVRRLGIWRFETIENPAQWAFGKMGAVLGDKQWKVLAEEHYSELQQALHNVADLVWIHQNAVLRAKVNGKLYVVVLSGDDPLQLLSRGLPVETILLQFENGCPDNTFVLPPCECRTSRLVFYFVKKERLSRTQLKSIQERILGMVPGCMGIEFWLNDTPVFPGPWFFPILYPYGEALLSLEQIRNYSSVATESHVVRWIPLHQR